LAREVYFEAYVPTQRFGILVSIACRIFRVTQMNSGIYRRATRVLLWQQAAGS